MTSDFTRLARVGLGGALVSVLLVFTIRVPDAYGLPKLVAGSLFAALACFAAWAGPAKRGVGRAPLDAAVLGVLGASLVCGLFSALPLRSLVGQYGYSLYGLLPVALFAALYFCATFYSHEDTVAFVLKWYLGAGILCGAYAVLQGVGIEPILPRVSDGSVSGRAISTLGGPVFLGSALIPFCPLGVGFILKKERGDRVLGALALTLSAAGIYFSGSRGAVAAAAVGALFAWVAADRLRARRWLRPVPLAIGAALLVGVFALTAGAGERRISDSQRYEIWKTAGRAFAAHPVFGVGPDSFEAAFRRYRSVESIRVLGWRAGQSDAHNDVLQAAATSGLVGLAAYGFLLWSLFLALRAALAGEERALAPAFAGAFVGLFIQAKVNPVSLAAIAPLCVFAGWLAPRGTPSAPGGKRWVAGTAVALSCVLLLVFAVFCRADHLRQRAETARARGDMDTTLISYRRALRLNPAYPEYFSSYGTVLVFLVRNAPQPLRRPLAKELFSLARRARRLHPGGIRGAHLFAMACVSGAELTGEDCREEASRELARARLLDPYSATVLRTSTQAALAQGDEAGASRFIERMEAVLALTRSQGRADAGGAEGAAALKILSASD